MYYNNDTHQAILELERQRTGNYAMDYDDDCIYKKECDECSKHGEYLFNVNSHVICSECICEILREEFSKVVENFQNDTVDCSTIFSEIISDFSDNELLCYVESIYPKVEN